MKFIKMSSIYVARLDQYREKKTTLFNVRNSKTYSINQTMYDLLTFVKGKWVDVHLVANHFNVKKNDIEHIVYTINSNFGNVIEINQDENYTRCNISENSFTPGLNIYSSPIYVEARLTDGCNLKCKHCAISASPNTTSRNISAEDWINFINELEMNNVFKIILTGGEVFYYKEIDKIIPFLKEKSIRFEILTNGTLIKPYHIKDLSHPNILINISLDGTSKEKHEILRGKGTFEKTLNNIKSLIEHGANIALTMVVHKKNIDEVEQYILYCIENNITQMGFILLAIEGRALYNKDLHLSIKEQKTAANKINTFKQKYENLEISFMDPLDLKYQIENRENENKEDCIISCSAGTNRIAIYEDGNVYPCAYAFNMKTFCIGNIHDNSLNEMWNHDNLRILRGLIRFSDLKDCFRCKIAETCVYKNCRLRDIDKKASLYTSHKICNTLVKYLS